MDKRNNPKVEPAEHKVMKMEKPLPVLVNKRVIVSEFEIKKERQPIGQGQYIRRAPVRAYREQDK